MIMIDGIERPMTPAETEEYERTRPTPQPEPAPTKEQLMAELAALTAKIQALE